MNSNDLDLDKYSRKTKNISYDNLNDIFSKEYITVYELAFLLGVDYYTASSIIQLIKQNSDRLNIKGKIHVEDYFDFYCIEDRSRYGGNAWRQDDNHSNKDSDSAVIVKEFHQRLINKKAIVKSS